MSSCMLLFRAPGAKGKKKKIEQQIGFLEKRLE
jgi:hypothetical protein